MKLLFIVISLSVVLISAKLDIIKIVHLQLQNVTDLNTGNRQGSRNANRQEIQQLNHRQKYAVIRTCANGEKNLKVN